MNLSGDYAVYIFSAYGISLVALGLVALASWRDWRRVRNAWDRLNRGGRA